MKRAPLKAAALAATIVAGALSGASSASAELPVPSAGGPAELLRYVGDSSSATGAAVSNGACDVNGDGFDDAVVGAWFWDKTPNTNIGATYVILGGPEVHGESLADPEEAGAVRIHGPAVNSAFTGFAVACVGDVNGDGLDDIAISHYTAQKAYVVFGAENFTEVALDSLGDRGFAVVGPSGSGNVGYSIARVGDLNDDGLDDFGVAEVAADTQGRTNNGRVWVIAGRDDISDVDLAAPAAGQVLLTVDGATNEERIGNIASVGDVNGDGVDDFLLGAYTSTPWGPTVAATGAAYVVFGGPTATGAIDAAALGTKGFTIVGPTRQRDRLGISVSAAGDVNADGKADLLVGADGVTNAGTGNRNGGAAVVFGSASTDRVYTDPAAASGQSVFTCDAPAPVTTTDPCTNPARRGYWINGAVLNDSAGFSVAGLGDVNGDGVPDLAVSAYGFDPANPAGGTFSGAGAVYVLYGNPAAVVQELGGLGAADGYRIDGTAAGDRFGRQIGLIGDLDDNGRDDLLVGADFAARGGTQNGELTVALLGRLNTEVVAAPSTADGDEYTFEAKVTKPAGDRTPLASGTVAFALEGTPIEGCEEIPVEDGVASCTATFDEPPTGTVVATYSGTDLLKGSESKPVPAVAPDGLLRVVTSPAVPSQITVDGAIADTWGLTWVKQPAGEHAVCFSAVPGYTTPGCQTVTLTGGETTTVTGTFVQRGTLRVVTSPAVDSTVSIDGVPRDNWGFWSDIPAGSHEVCFGAVAGYTPPACQTVDLAAGATETVTGTFEASEAAGPSGVGALRVTTSPALPSQITVDGQIADSWGLNWLQVAPGSHTVCFGHVEGYSDPACETVTVADGATSEVTGTFTQRGFLKVVTSPATPGTITVDGVPANDWGTYTDRPVGDHEVCFGRVDGMTAPACQTATVTAGELTTITGLYT